MTHSEASKQAKVSTPCTAAHITFGGRCLNCGYEPQELTGLPKRTHEERVFYTDTPKGIAEAERYKARLNNKYVRVTVLPLGMNRTRIVGAVLIGSQGE